MSSQGAFAIQGKSEYIEYQGDVYKGDVSMPLDSNGYRNGVRWLCSENAWSLYSQIVERDGGRIEYLHKEESTT